MGRQLRVPLGEWRTSSENRRVLRKAGNLQCELVPRDRFDLTPERRAAWLAFAEARFGSGVMSAARLDRLLAGRVISHLLVFRDGGGDGPERGVALLYLEPPRMAYYYYAFYDLSDSGSNLGLGETQEEVLEAMRDLRQAHCDILTLGQYLQPTLKHLPVVDFIPPAVFDSLRREGDAMGFTHVASGPLVRSSYHADEFSPIPPA